MTLQAQWQMQQNLDQHARYIEGLLAKQTDEEATGDTDSGGDNAATAADETSSGGVDGSDSGDVAAADAKGGSCRGTAAASSGATEQHRELQPAPAARLQGVPPARSMHLDQLRRSASPAQCARPSDSQPLREAAVALSLPVTPHGGLQQQLQAPLQGGPPAEQEGGALLHARSPSPEEQLLELHPPLPQLPPLAEPPFTLLPPDGALLQPLEAEGGATGNLRPSSPGSQLAGESLLDTGTAQDGSAPREVEPLQEPLLGHPAAPHDQHAPADWL